VIGIEIGKADVVRQAVGKICKKRC
jgi:hypothetical protein